MSRNHKVPPQPQECSLSTCLTKKHASNAPTMSPPPIDCLASVDCIPSSFFFYSLGYTEYCSAYT